MTYEHHPASEMFPMMTGDDLKALAEDIRENGQREPIVLLDGKILDGRNRYKACEIAGVEPRFVEYDCWVGPDLYVLSMNLHRRHLTHDEKAMIAHRKVRPEFEEQTLARRSAFSRTTEDVGVPSSLAPRGRQRVEIKTAPSRKGRSSELAGSIVGVSGRQVERAATVEKHSAELADKVERGEMSLSEAYKIATNGRVKKTERQQQVESSQKRRVFDALGVIRGGCRGLREAKIERLRDGLTSSELGDMLTVVKTAVRELNEFARRLKNEVSENGGTESSGK